MKTNNYLEVLRAREAAIRAEHARHLDEMNKQRMLIEKKIFEQQQNTFFTYGGGQVSEGIGLAPIGVFAIG